MASITDPVGIVSAFHYQDGDDIFIDSMTTPYGTTQFSHEERGNDYRAIQAVDPLFGTERAEYHSAEAAAPPEESDAPAGVTNSGLNLQTTYFWDKKAMLDHPGNYTIGALAVHWLTSKDGTTVSGIKHSEKRPLESRVWYSYDGQADGSIVGATAAPNTVTRLFR